MYPWEPSGLSSFFHYFPHYDFSLREVSSLYNIHIYPYRQSVFLAGSIHLLWLLIAILIMLAALLQRWCTRRENMCPKDVCECDMCWPRLYLFICILLIIVCLVFEALIHAIILSNMKIDKKRVVTYKPLFPTIRYNIFPFIRDFFDSERYMMDQISHYAKHPYERFQKDCNGYLIPPEYYNYWSKVESWQSSKLNNTNLTYSEPNTTDKEHPLQYLYKEVRPWRRFFYFLFVWCFLLFLIIVCLCMIKKDEFFWVPLFLTLVMTCLAAVSLTVVAVALGDACQDPLYTSTFLESIVHMKAQETYCQDWTKEVCITLLDLVNRYNDMLYKHLETVKRSITDHKKIGNVSFIEVCDYRGADGICKESHKEFHESDWINEEIQHHHWVKTLRENQASKKYEDMLTLRIRCQEFEFACPETVRRISYDTEGAVKSFCEYDCILLPICIQLVAVLIMAALLFRSLLVYIATRPCVLPRKRNADTKKVKNIKVLMKCWIKSKRRKFVKSIHEQTPLTLLGKAFRRFYFRMRKFHRRKVIIVKKYMAIFCKTTHTKCDIEDKSFTRRCPSCRTSEDRLKCKFCSPCITSPVKVISGPPHETYSPPCPPPPRHPCPEQSQDPKEKTTSGDRAKCNIFSPCCKSSISSPPQKVIPGRPHKTYTPPCPLPRHPSPKQSQDPKEKTTSEDRAKCNFGPPYISSPLKVIPGPPHETFSPPFPLPPRHPYSEQSQDPKEKSKTSKEKSTSEDRAKCNFCPPYISSPLKVIPGPPHETFSPPFPLPPRHPCSEQSQDPKEKSKTSNDKTSVRRSKHTKHKTLETPENSSNSSKRPDPEITHSQKSVMQTKSHCKPLHQLLPSDIYTPPQPTTSKHVMKQRSHLNTDHYAEWSPNVIVKIKQDPICKTPSPRKDSKPKDCSKTNLPPSHKPFDEDIGTSSENRLRLLVHSMSPPADDTKNCSSEGIESLSSVSVTPNVTVDASFYFNNPAYAPCDIYTEKDKLNHNNKVDDPYKQDQLYKGRSFKRPIDKDACKPRNSTGTKSEEIQNLENKSELQRIESYDHTYFEEPLYSYGCPGHTYAGGKPTDIKPRARYIKNAATRPSVLSIPSCSRSPYQANTLKVKKSILRRMKTSEESLRNRETGRVEIPESYDCPSVLQTTAVMRKKSNSLTYRISYRTRNQVTTKKQKKRRTVFLKVPANMLKPRDGK